MLIDTSQDYACRVNGIPLYYSTSYVPTTNTYRKDFCPISSYSPYATPSPPCDILMTSKVVPSPRNLSPPLITLTPPLSPFNSSNASPAGDDQSRRRGSVIMKVENCQITPANDSQISIDHVCRWENCYR